MSAATEETGIPELDYVTGGLSPNALVIVIGPPGTGKTVMALQMAMHHAKQGKDVILFSAFSEPHEKLVSHADAFTFFDSDLVGDRITMLSLKSVLRESAERTMETILVSTRGKRDPLLIIDGYRGMREILGVDMSQDLLAGLSSQMPYHHARCIVTSESVPDDPQHLAELASADVLIGLYNTRHGAQPVRFLEILKVRGHGYREGIHGMALSNQGIAVYPRLSTAMPDTVPTPTAQRRAFGLTAFDDMLGGGLPEFSSTVLVGDPGTGKTTLSLHYLIAGAKVGDCGLLVTLGETTVDLLQKADDLGLDLRSHIEAGRLHILEIPPVEIDPYRLGWQIHELVEAQQVTRLVIDSITRLEEAPGVQESQHDYLSALSVYLRRMGVTTVMTQDTVVQSMIGRGRAFVRMPAAQNRVLLRRVPYSGRLYRIFSILNMQRSAHDTSIREFAIGRGGVRILDAAETERGVLAGIEREQPIIA